MCCHLVTLDISLFASCRLYDLGILNDIIVTLWVDTVDSLSGWWYVLFEIIPNFEFLYFRIFSLQLIQFIN